MDLQKRISEPSRSVTGGSKEFLVSRKTMHMKKVRGPESPLYLAICPLVYNIRVFGLAPYEFHNDTLVPSSINSSFAFAFLIVHTYIIYTVLTRFMSVEQDAPLLGHTETMKAAFNFFMAIFDILNTLFSREKFVRIWNVMQDYDEIVMNLGYARSERRTCVWAWFILVANLLTWIAVHKFGMAAFGEPWVQNVAYMIIYVGSSVSVIKFSGMALMLGQRFHHLNVVAKKNGPLASRWRMASPVIDAKDIEYLHNVLMTAAESLNDIYSWSLLFWLANLCLHIVSDFYFVIQRLMRMTWTLHEWKIVSCLISWIASFIGQLVILNYACDFAASEANCMGYIMINWRRWLKLRRREASIYRLTPLSYLRPFARNVETSIHLINRRLNFSASGCCSVELPLLRSIAALLTTYLVILIQFSV